MTWSHPGGGGVVTWSHPRGEGGVVTRSHVHVRGRGRGGVVQRHLVLQHLPPPPGVEVTHACENITFARFAKRAVMKQ